MDIRESGENYLETILLLQNKNGSVRSVDIANELCFTKASISRAMGILKKSEYIEVEAGGNILLTEKGKEKAEEILTRHRLISKFLIITLGVSEEIADKDACRIEHIISCETFNKMKRIVTES